MRKFVMAILIGLFLTGCARADTFETIEDDRLVAVFAEKRQILLDVPEDASILTMQTDAGTIYLCDGYEIMLETFWAGDLDRTIQSVTGYHQEDLTVLETGSDGFVRHDFVWSAAGEQGNRLGKGAVLDDGTYHYVLSVMADADNAPILTAQWEKLFDSYGLA